MTPEQAIAIKVKLLDALALECDEQIPVLEGQLRFLEANPSLEGPPQGPPVPGWQPSGEILKDRVAHGILARKGLSSAIRDLKSAIPPVVRVVGLYALFEVEKVNYKGSRKHLTYFVTPTRWLPARPGEIVSYPHGSYGLGPFGYNREGFTAELALTVEGKSYIFLGSQAPTLGNFDGLRRGQRVEDEAAASGFGEPDVRTMTVLSVS